MYQTFILSLTLLTLPTIARAQALQVSLVNIVTFLSDIIIPFLVGLAFLFFVINVVRFFIIGGSNDEGREKAKALAIYGTAAFVLMVIFWGIVNLLASSIGLDGCSQPSSDYVSRSFVGPTLPPCS